MGGAAAAVDVRPAYRRNGDLALTLVNGGSAAVLLKVGRRHTVTVPAGGRREVEWRTDHGWYDVAVTCPDDDTFRRRLTGRVETGRDSVTP